MGLLNYLGGRGSSGYGEGSSRHVESDVGGVTVGGAALEEEKSWEQPDPSVDNLPFTSFDDVHVDDARRRSSATPPARDFARRAVGLFVLVMICIGFLDTLADPEEGRRVLASCGVKSPSRLRSTLTALLIWAVMVSAVRALALAAFVYITRFNVDNRVGEI